MDTRAHLINVKRLTLLCISCSTCPTIYVKNTYRRAPEKGSNPVVTRNRRIAVSYCNAKFSMQNTIKCKSKDYTSIKFCINKVTFLKA